MDISIDNVTTYLLERDLLNMESIVDESIKIIDISGKNRNIKVIRRNYPSYLIKQPYASDFRSADTLRTEAYLYYFVKNSNLKNTVNIMPNIIAFDDERNIEVLEFIDNSLSVYQYVEDKKFNIFPVDIALAIGRIMATYHNSFRYSLSDPKLSFLPRAIPDISFISKPGPEIFTHLSPANLQLLKIIQDHHQLLQTIHDLETMWIPHTVIHGDIKLENMIISSYDTARHFVMRIVDWELAAIGDCAWDIAAIFKELLVFWIYLSKGRLNQQLQQSANNSYANQSIQSIQSACRGFWSGYIRTEKIGNEEARDLLKRSITYCAIYLVVRAYEIQQFLNKLSNSAVYMLQLALNILKDINKSIMFLLGITDSGEIYNA